MRACAPAPMCVCKHAQMRRECERNMLMNTCMHAWMHGCIDTQMHTHVQRSEPQEHCNVTCKTPAYSHSLSYSRNMEAKDTPKGYRSTNRAHATTKAHTTPGFIHRSTEPTKMDALVDRRPLSSFAAVSVCGCECVNV